MSQTISLQTLIFVISCLTFSNQRKMWDEDGMSNLGSQDTYLQDAFLPFLMNDWLKSWQLDLKIIKKVTIRCLLVEEAWQVNRTAENRNFFNFILLIRFLKNQKSTD